MTYHSTDPYPHPVITSRPIRADVRVAGFHLDTQAARAELAAAKIRDVVLKQLEDALPGITPKEAAKLLDRMERETQVTTHPDGSVSMYLAFNVAAKEES